MASGKPDTKELPPLEPPDPDRCQAEIQEYRPFVMGGKVRQVERCKKRPTVILIENRPGEDGRRGSMSLCDECLKVFNNTPGTPVSTVWRKQK